MNDVDVLTVTAATETERLLRMAQLGNNGTAGGEGIPPSADVLHFWTDGWWVGARRVPAHAQRVGGPIKPWGVVVHTTDMVDGDWDALVNGWRTRPGDGACAHFLIGRDEGHGVLQFAPVFRNGNHAGGSGHGVFDTDDAKGIHPNLVTVGIELMCAGGVREINGIWWYVEGGKVHGDPIDAEDVIPDPLRPGRGWHRVTDWQYERLGALLLDLELVLGPLPAGARSRSTGEAVPTWAIPKSARVVGHVSLDPEHRGDPWPETCARLFR